MPSVGQVLDLLEAISRRDWGGVSQVGREIADSERKKKHYEAANQILEAVEIASSQAGFDQIGTLSAPTTQVITQVPAFIEALSIDGVPDPALEHTIRRELNEFVNEWGFESQLRKQGLSPRHTLLLFGPPGCGKTLLAKHIARSLKMKMFVVRFDTLISSFLGETGANIRKVFEFLAANRCVLLLDELDAIAKLRDDRNELGELKRVVISLLQNLDLTNTQSLLIAATNHPHMLDPALWRRFETVWELKEPVKDDRSRIFEQGFGKPLPKQVAETFLEGTTGMTGSDLTQIAVSAKRKGLIDSNVSENESVLLALLEYIRRTAQSQDQRPEFTERLISTSLHLRTLEPQKYSFNNLAMLSGVSHSTLHSRESAQR